MIGVPDHAANVVPDDLSPVSARSNCKTARSLRAELRTDPVSEICRYNPELTNGNTDGPDPVSTKAEPAA
jgi:hypothetical protein